MDDGLWELEPHPLLVVQPRELRLLQLLLLEHCGVPPQSSSHPRTPRCSRGSKGARPPSGRYARSCRWRWNVRHRHGLDADEDEDLVKRREDKNKSGVGSEPEAPHTICVADEDCIPESECHGKHLTPSAGKYLRMCGQLSPVGSNPEISTA
ncbi:hypothetical protein SELMODRAFT_411082 [Selaginella moellendorffii]|uniref:Uncharacterized protein n=1 Tax=Selaginella moellendorffii TaxID=88036 RepID=D8RGI9_SELML|nr:hypothetical protein SELMODRAFT_411082 [Selaginella moellendorffii]